MKKPLRDYLNQFELMSYRMRDGSSVVANEEYFDDESQTFAITRAVEIKVSGSGKSFFIPWILTGDDEMVQIHKDNIIAAAPTSEDIQIQYHRYILKNNLQEHMTDNEIEIVLSQLFDDDLDNLDDVEIDGGYEDYTMDDDPPKTLEWRKQWKPYDN